MVVLVHCADNKHAVLPSSTMSRQFLTARYGNVVISAWSAKGLVLRWLAAAFECKCSVKYF